MHVYTLDEGGRLVRAARSTIELSLRNPHFRRESVSGMTKGMGDLDGVFVTLENYPTRALRGCTGFSVAVAPIGEAVIDAAGAAAFEDPRFVPVSHKELDRLLVEVSVLTGPKEIEGKAESRYRRIKVGRDGLIAKYGVREGLLLPIVAVEQGWSAKRFLEETCIKAGMPANAWLQQNVKVLSFMTQVFREKEPGGSVVEVAPGSARMQSS